MKFQDVAENLKSQPLGDDINFRIAIMIDKKDGYPWLTYAMQTWLNDPTFKIQSVQVQKQVTTIPGTKTSYMDLLVTDINGRQYNVEIQKYYVPYSKFGRWFYYISQIIVQQVAQGEDYDLTDTASGIIICKKDPLGKGLPVYTIEPNVRQLGLPLENLIDKKLYSIQLINAEADSDDTKNILARSVFEADLTKIENTQTANLVRKLRSEEGKEVTMEVLDMFGDLFREYCKDALKEKDDVIKEKDEEIRKVKEEHQRDQCKAQEVHLRDQEEIRKLREENSVLKSQQNRSM